MLLGTDLGAYEFRLTTQSAASNNMMSLLTSLVTGRNNQANVGQYIHWGSKLIFGLITTEANYDSVVGDFLKFVNTFKLDTSYKTNIKKLASGRPSQNTSSGNGGLSLTDILTGILKGHHLSDVIETTVMAMFYSSQLQGMMPKLHSLNFGGMELIRPM